MYSELLKVSGQMSVGAVQMILSLFSKSDFDSFPIWTLDICYQSIIRMLELLVADFSFSK